MNIKSVRVLKAELESEIRKLLVEFTNRVEAKITDIDFNLIVELGNNDGVDYRVNITATI